MKPLTRLAAALLSLSALIDTAAAHEGHGLSGTHWHATDAVGYLVAAGVFAVLWFNRKK